MRILTEEETHYGLEGSLCTNQMFKGIFPKMIVIVISNIFFEGRVETIIMRNFLVIFVTKY